MNNKVFIESVAKKCNMNVDEVGNLSSALIASMLECAAMGNSLTIQGFGSFEPREKASRKMYNPTTKSYIEVPHKVILGYKMSAVLKERINQQ